MDLISTKLHGNRPDIGSTAFWTDTLDDQSTSTCLQNWKSGLNSGNSTTKVLSYRNLFAVIWAVCSQFILSLMQFCWLCVIHLVSYVCEAKLSSSLKHLPTKIFPAHSCYLAFNALLNCLRLTWTKSTNTFQTLSASTLQEHNPLCFSM